MKLITLSVFMAALFSFTPGAMAIGPMEKDDIRAGQLICEGNGSGLKSGITAGTVRSDERRESSGKSAQ